MLLLIIIVCSLCILFPVFMCFIMNNIKAMKYFIKDFIRYIRYKQWRTVASGQIIAYVGMFGRGKTLSLVHHAVQIYERKNNKRVYDIITKKWVQQKIIIYSNVELNIPYIKFVSMEQVVKISDEQRTLDEQNGTKTISIIVGDEFSVQMNSRSFKSNFNPLLLNTILTCRHHNITLLYSAQRFVHVDALLRQVTSYVVDCDKLWRFQKNYKYDAWEMENATNTLLLKPRRRKCWFVQNKDFEAYDTLACVGNLKKSWSEGDMLSEEEILTLTVNQGNGMENVLKPSRTYIKKRKKMTK